ncbi:MAG TPA: flavin reductase family protein [Bryobacteraceae bacterium]|nr:flavin reductase family protein [Bryobacteraceae bacterium]
MDVEARKKTLRMFSNGIYIITSRSGDQYGGATVSWVSQASFKPPLVMAAIRKESNVFRCMKESGKAVIHVLGSDQRELAQRFFTPTKVDAGLMNSEPFHLGKTSLPVLESAPAYVECCVRGALDDLGDHAVVVLEVLEAEWFSAVHPLTMTESPWEYGG